MGGAAFGSARAAGQPTLRTPRMSSGQYESTKHRCIGKLKAYLPDATVLAIPDAPEKVDHGDVDLYIGYGGPDIDWMKLTKALGGTAVILTGVKKCTLAVPLDEEPNPTIPRGGDVIVYSASDKSSPTTPSLTREAYAQVDINIVKPELIDWWGLYASYGDMVGLLGSMSTMGGFQLSDRGFSLRIAELERGKTVVNQQAQHPNLDNASGLLFLSRDPDKVLEFVGLSPDRFRAGFDTLEQLFQWLSKCRLLGIRTSMEEEENNNLKTTRRYHTRPIFREFFTKWLPAHRPKEALSKEEQAAMRQHFANEAVDFFNVRTEYEARRNAILRSIGNATAAALLRPMLVQHSGHSESSSATNEIARAFRRHVGWSEVSSEPCILSEPRADAESALYTMLGEDGTRFRCSAGVDRWVADTWRPVLEAERHRRSVTLGKAQDSERGDILQKCYG